MFDDIEAEAVLAIARNVVAKPFINGVVGVKGQDDRVDLFDFRFGNVNRIANDNFVAFLAGSGRCTIQNATLRTALAIYHIGTDTRAGIFIPDVDKLHWQNPCCFTVIRVQSDGSVVIEIGSGDANAVQLTGDNFSHFHSRKRLIGGIL